MAIKETFIQRLKSSIAVITGAASLVGVIAGGILYTENTFARSDDVERILRNQTTQIRLFDQAQRSNSLFQLEYYDNRLQQLQLERERAQAQRGSQARGLTRSVEDIQADINEVKQRREVVRKIISEPVAIDPVK